MSALRHLVRAYVYNPDTGREDLCRAESFAGWQRGDSMPAGRGFLTFQVPKINKAAGRARVDVRFIPTDPYGVVGFAPCGGGTEFTDLRPLIAQEPTADPNPPSLLGNGGPGMRR